MYSYSELQLRIWSMFNFKGFDGAKHTQCQGRNFTSMSISILEIKKKQHYCEVCNLQ